ncbi:VWA domain-containing protein [Pleionea sp. CnH1-48]|uniref:vWA domain-containing protein n=1 Tax=Pleionea sp. CnH1-48 TaxID=2954494 RepID=UPI0020980218|nr:VWA domain-containing protein [Pleionea sp. CnH1-48]MCO7222977.1 VWA domain-containing protein [Pleionea sp. CnH1-48]
MFEFAWPLVFALLPLPLITYWLLPKANDSQAAALRTSLFYRWTQLTTQTSHDHSRQNLPMLISYLFWALLVTALARPQWIGEPQELPPSGRDLLISIDISGSMEVQDLTLNNRPESRLFVVQHILSDFIERRKGDRMGMILFGERAYLQTPLTFDSKTVNHMLMEAEIGLAGQQRTVIGDSIGLAVKRLKERPEENRVLILLTDGQNNSGQLEPIEAAKLAAHAGIRIYTIGVGADEMLIKDMIFGTRKINPSEDLDEKTLTSVAKITGGKYFRARDEKELKRIYEELDKLEPVEDEKEIYRPIAELYFYPVFIGVGLYLLLYLLSLLINRKTAES